MVKEMALNFLYKKHFVAFFFLCVIGLESGLFQVNYRSVSVTQLTRYTEHRWPVWGLMVQKMICVTGELLEESVGRRWSAGKD